MIGATDLQKMLNSLEPRLRDGEFVFCSFENARYGDHAHLEPVGSCAEAEGLTLVVPRTKADEHSVPYASVFRCITLSVHSSLDAVGLTAAFAKRLTEHGISANVLAGYFHDHIFVQADHAQRALDALRDLSGAD